MADNTPLDWPSTPNANGLVPPLIELLSAPEPLAGHVMLLMNNSAALAKKVGGKLDGFQIPLQTPFGKISIPGVLKLADNTIVLLFSHQGEWADADLMRLLRWTVALRTHPPTMRLKIEILSDLQSVPQSVLETADNGLHTVAGICSQMLINPMSPEQALPNVLLILSHVLGRRLDFDRESLLAVDAFVQANYPPISDDWVLRNASLSLFGFFLGECIARARGGKWADSAAPFPEWMKQIQIGAHSLNPLGRASKFLRDPKHDPLTELFDMTTPEVLARTEASLNKRMEGQSNA